MCISVATVRPAHATALEDAVTLYNSSTAHLSDDWGDYVTNLAVAFDAYDTMMCAWQAYQESTTGDPDELWTDFLDAYDDAVVAGDIANDNFDLILDEYTDAGGALKIVLLQDLFDSPNVAYSTGTVFTCPATPFVFWQDPEFGTSTEFPVFAFPVLVVGSAGSHTSYTSSTLNGILSIWDDLKDWIKFPPWALKHKDDGNECNATRAQDYDDLCACCTIGLAYPRTSLHARGYTDEMIDEYCETYGDSCDDEQSNAAKAADLRRLFPDKMEEDLQVPVDAAEDWVTEASREDLTCV